MERINGRRGERNSPLIFAYIFKMKTSIVSYCLANILFTVLLLSTPAYGKEINTKYFSIVAPDSLLVESGDGRILISGPNGPYEKPLQFMSIEYGPSDQIGLDILLADANTTLGQAKEGTVVDQVECSPGCTAYFGSVKQAESAMDANLFFFVIRGENISAIIAYGFQGEYDEARSLVEDIARQIMSGRI